MISFIERSTGSEGFRLGDGAPRFGRGIVGRGASRRVAGPLRRRPPALALRLVAGLEGLTALHAWGGLAGRGSVNELDQQDTLRLATGASLLAAAGRPHLRVGALVTATLGHSLRMLTLAFDPGARHRKERLAVELAMSSVLGGLLREAARASRWDR